MHFKVFGYFITSKKEDKDPEFDERLEETAEQSLLSLVEKERATRPVLVFCGEEALTSIWEDLTEFIDISEMKTHADLERVE